MDIKTSGSVSDPHVDTPHEQNRSDPATESSHTRAGSLYNGMKTNIIPPASQVSPYQTPFRAENTKGLTNRTQELLPPQHKSAFTLKINDKTLYSTPEFEEKVSHLGQRVSVHAKKEMRMVSATFVVKHDHAEHKQKTSLITEKAKEPATPNTSRRADELGKIASKIMQEASEAPSAPSASSAMLIDSKWIPAHSNEWTAIAEHKKNNQEYQRVLREVESTSRTSSRPASHVVSRDILSTQPDSLAIAKSSNADFRALLNSVNSKLNIPDASSAERMTTAPAHSMDRTSEQLDRQYEQDLTGSDPVHLSEGRDDGSMDRPELTASLEKRSSESFSADRKTSEAEVTQSPDTGQSEQHLPGEIETQSDTRLTLGKDKLKDDEPLNVHRQQSETSLGTSGDRNTDSPTIDAEVHTPGGREPDGTFSPASPLPAQEDIRFITDEPPTATDATGHRDAGMLAGKPPLKGPEKSLLSDDDQTVDEVDVETRESVSASPSMSHEPVRSRLASETDQTATEKLSPEATITGDELSESGQMATTATVTEPTVTPHDLTPSPDDMQRPAGTPPPSLPLTDETVTTETPLRTTGETVGETTVEDRVEERRQDQYRAPSPIGSHPSRQGGVSGDSSTIDTGLETHTTEQEIIEQTSTETREELTIQDDSVVSRLKAPDGRSADKATTELAPSTGGVSEKLDTEYDHSRIRSDSTHLPEEQEPLSVESQQPVVTTGSSSDGKPDAGSPTIDPDLTVAAPLFTSEPSDHEDKDSASEGEGKDGWRTPPEALTPSASTQPPESLSRVTSEDDTHKQDPEVLAKIRQSTAPEQDPLSPAATRQLASQEDSNILTDVPPSATDETVGADTTETQSLTAEQKRVASGEQVITVEDMVEEIHQDQYRTPSPLGSHPSQQGKATDDTSTVDPGLETQTTELDITEQTSSETQEELTAQGDSAVDAQVSEAKTKDYRSIFSSVLKGLPSDRSVSESDASTVEKTATASLEKRSSESFSADRKTSEAKVTASPDTGRSEGEIETQSGIHPAPGQGKLKDDEPLNVHSQQPETSLGTSGDRDTDSPTIDAEVHTPGGREPDSTSSPASLPAAQEDITFITDEPPTATDATGHHDAGLFTGKSQQKGPEKSLLPGDDKTVDEAIDEVKVETRESVSTSPSISHEPVRSRLASETDQSATGKLSTEAPVTGDELSESGQMATTATVIEPTVTTPHDLAPAPDDKQSPAGTPPPSLPLTDETVTTETPLRTIGETVGETTAEDRVEERRQDQYRTPSPIGSHPSRQGGVPEDSSAIDTGLETHITEQEIIEQIFSETREEVIIQDKPAASLPKEPTPGLTERDTEAGLSIPPSSDHRDPQYDQSLISSSPTHLPEDHGPLSFESQPSVVTTGSSSESDSDDTTSDSDADSVKSFGDRKDESTLHMTLDGFSKDKSDLSDDETGRISQASSHSRASSDGEQDMDSPTIDPDLTVAAPLFTSEPSDHEDKDSASEGEGKDGWRTPPEALAPSASTQPPESLSRVTSEDDTHKQDPEVLAKIRQSTAPEQAPLSPLETRRLASQEDSNILTDVPSVTDETVGADTTETQSLTAEQKRVASGEQVMTVEETVVETTVEDMVEEIRQDQYRTPSPLGNHPSQQGKATDDTSTVDTGLETQTTGLDITGQTSSETQEELTAQGDSAADAQVSEAKTKDYRSIFSSVLKDLPSDRSVSESDASTVEKTATASLEKRSSESFIADRKASEAEVTASPDTGRAEQHPSGEIETQSETHPTLGKDKLKDDEPLNVHSQQPETSLGTSGDRDTDSPTIDAEVHTPGGREPDSTSSPASLPAAQEDLRFITDVTPTATDATGHHDAGLLTGKPPLKGPEKSLLSGDDKTVDEAIDEVKVETRESVSASQSMSHEPVRSRLASDTDQSATGKLSPEAPVTGDELPEPEQMATTATVIESTVTTPHDLAPAPDDKQRPAGTPPPSLPLTDEMVTTETPLGTTVEDRVEERRQDQYRTPSPLGSHPSQQGKATDDTSTVDPGLETQTTELDITGQTSSETQEELTAQDDSAADAQASEVKTKDYRSIFSSVLKDLPSDRSAREADASTVEKTAIASLEKRSSESFSADRKTSEAAVTQSPDTGRSEGEIETQSGIHPAPGQGKLKDDEPLNVHSQQPETSLGTSGDRDTDSPTIDAEVHTPGGREPDSTSSPASLPAAQEDITFITDEPPTATDATGHHDAGLFTGKSQQKGPEKSLLPGDDKTVDEAIDEVKVETRESVSTSPSISHEPVRSRLASETDQSATGKLSTEAPVTGDELSESGQMATTATVIEPTVTTPHDLAPAPDDKQSPAGTPPPSLPLTDETVTTETPLRTIGETVGETTAEDRVEERRQDQYRTPSPIGSHPSRQGGVPEDSSAIDTGLETHITEQEIIEQIFSETREEVIIQDKPAASLPKEPTPGLTERDTEAGLSIPPSSDHRDPQYDQSLISSSPTHLPEDHGPLSFESQPSVVTTGSSSESDSDDTTSDSDADSVKSFGDRKDESTLHMTLDGFSKDKSDLSDDETGRISQARSHSRTSSDGEQDMDSPTIDPDLTVAAPLFTSEPSDHEDKDSASEGEGKDGWRTPPEALAPSASTQPPESLSRVTSEDDTHKQDPEVLAKIRQSTAPEQAPLSPLETRRLASQEDSNILTDVPSVTDKTVGADTTETQSLTAEQKRVASGEQVITVEETVVETTVEDMVEEIHQDQYRTSSPLGSHPSQQGKATDDTSTVDPGLETQTTGLDITEQTSSETQEELTAQGDSAADVQTSERQTSLEESELLNEFQKVAKQSVGEKAQENIQDLTEGDKSDRLSPVTGSSNNTTSSPVGMISSLAETGLRPETEEAMHRIAESMREQVASEGARNLKSQDSMVESSKPESLSTASDVPEPVVTTYLPSDIDKQQSHTARYTITHTTKKTKETTDELTITETQRETTTDKEGLDNQSVQYDSNPDLSVTEKITDLDISDTSEYGRQRSDSSSSSSASEEEYHIPQDPVDTEPGHRKLENISQGKLENIPELMDEEPHQSGDRKISGDSSIHFEDIQRYAEDDLGSVLDEPRHQRGTPSSASMDSSLSLPAEADPDLMTQTIMRRTERKVDDLEVRGADREDSGETTIDDKSQEAITQQGKMSLLPTVSTSTMEGSQLQQSSATLDPADGVQDEQSVVSEQTLVRSGFSTEHRTVETEGSEELFSASKTLEREVHSGAESSQTVSEEPKTLAAGQSIEQSERRLYKQLEQSRTGHIVSVELEGSELAAGDTAETTSSIEPDEDKMVTKFVDRALKKVLSEERERHQMSTSEKSESLPAEQHIDHVEQRLTKHFEKQSDGFKVPIYEPVKAETAGSKDPELVVGDAGDVAETITSKEKDMDQSLEKVVAELVSEDSDHVLSDERERHKSSIATGSSSDVELSAARVTGDSDEFKFRPQTDEEVERVSASMRKEYLKSKRTTTTVSIYMTKTESHKTELKANVVPGRATEQQSIEHSVRSQITVGSTAPKKQVKWASWVDPASSSASKETQQQEEPLKTEAASASSLVESVIGAEKAEGVSTPSSSSDDIRTRTVKVSYITYGTTSKPYAEEKFQAGSSIESLREWLNNTRAKFKDTYLSRYPMQVEVISKIKGSTEDSKIQVSFTEAITKKVPMKEPDAPRTSAVSPTFEKCSSALFSQLTEAETKSDKDTTRV